MPHSACASLTAEIVVAISAGRRWRSISRQPGAVREHGNTGRAPLVVEAAEALAAAAALSLMEGAVWASAGAVWSLPGVAVE